MDAMEQACETMLEIQKRKQGASHSTFRWADDVANVVGLVQRMIANKITTCTSQDVATSLDKAGLIHPGTKAIGKIFGKTVLGLERGPRRKSGLVFRLPSEPISEERLRKVFPSRPHQVMHQKGKAAM